MEPPAAPKQSTGQQLGFGRANVRFPSKKRMRLGNDLQMVGKRHIHVCLQAGIFQSPIWSGEKAVFPEFSIQIMPTPATVWNLEQPMVQWVNLCQKTFTDTWLDTC